MLWKVLGTGGAVAAAFTTQKAMNLVWHAAMGHEPPQTPESPESDWVEAVAWAAVSGALIGLARMVATRQAARAYYSITGDLPKPMRRD